MYVRRGVHPGIIVNFGSGPPDAAMIEELRKQLEQEEGRVRWAYQDSRGLWTIGIGTLIDRKGGGLEENEIDYLFNNRLVKKMTELAKALPWTNQLDEVRRAALINMAYQMGTDGLLQFTTMLAHLKTGNYLLAYNDALDSKWAKQTPERAKRVATQLLTGVWQWQ
jgi:lysozyme